MKNFFRANKLFFEIAWAKHKFYYFSYAISILYSVFNTMILVYMPKMVLHAIIDEKNFILAVTWICIGIIVSLIWSYIEKKIYLSQRVILTNILVDMKSILYTKIIGNNMMEFEDNEQFNALTRALNYTESAGDGVVNILANAVQNILTFVGVSYVIGKINILVVLIIVLTIILGHLCMKKVNKMWFKFQQTERLSKVRFINYMIGLFSNKDFISEIKINNSEGFAKSLLLDKILELTRKESSEDGKRYKWNYISIVLNNLHKLIAQIYFGFLLFKGLLDFATYSTLFAAIEVLVASVNNFLGLSIDFSNKINEANYYMDFINDGTYRYNGNIKLNKFSNIKVSNLKFRYPKQDIYAINNISLEFQKGDVIAIVGENGSGKTTLIKLLMGLYPVESGEITIDDLNIEEIEIRSWLNKISLVMQNSVHLPIEISKDIAMSSEIDYVRLKKSMEFAGIKNKVDTLPNKENTIISKQFNGDGQDLSGGEMQKLSIARAYYKDAEILVFDEPSSALDPNAEYELFKKIEQLEREKTVIYISHRLSATVHAKKIFVLEQGHLVESGTHKELMNLKGVYYKMFCRQADNYVEGSL